MKEEVILEVPFPGVHPDFIPYVDRFVHEANIRGKNENGVMNSIMKELSVTYDPFLYESGYCGYGTPMQGILSGPTVVISNHDDCWEIFSEVRREIFMFHELGHAVLRRPHLNDSLPNGDIKSIMNADFWYKTYSDTSSAKKQYYLDELFDLETAVPGWAED